MSTEQEKDSFALKRNRGGDGGLDGLGGPGLLLGSPDKKKRKASTQAPSFAALSEYAPPANPSSDHLVASNPFDDNYSSPPPSLKQLNATNPFFGPSHYPGFGGYGPPRMAPQIQNRMPSSYGGPYQLRNQPTHPFAQNPMVPIGLGFNRLPGFSYGHLDNPAFANQTVFNNNNSSTHLPPGQPFRPGPGENFNQLPLPNVNQNQSGPDGPGPGFGPEGTGNLPPTVKLSPDMSPGHPQPPSNFGQSNMPTSMPKQDPNETANSKNTTSPRKQSKTSEEGGRGQNAQVEPKGKNRANTPAGLEGGVEKVNGMIHPGTDLLKKSPQPRALIETLVERNRRPGTTCRSGAAVTSKKSSAHLDRSNNTSSSEPVYPCGICLSEVNDDQEAILCEASCQKWFHRVCTGMTETAYNLLTAETAAVWGCDSCMEEKGAQLLKTCETPGLPTANSKGQS